MARPLSRQHFSTASFRRCALVAAFAMAFSLAFSAGPARFHVEVSVSAPGSLGALHRAGLDVAGVNRRAQTATVLASREEMALLNDLLLPYEVIQEREESAPVPADLANYSDPAEVLALMDETEQLYPNLAKTFLISGPLFEGHLVYAMKITKDVSSQHDRPAFILDSQHHAREVMTTEVALDMITYLTSRYEYDAQVRNWVDNIEIWVVPCVNPDGAQYVFAHDNWQRKNRHPDCNVDLNRNYGWNWDACYGSSGFCASETFRGETPDSEPETQAMLGLFDSAPALFGLSYHSYGEYILYPYGCGDPEEMAIYEEVGQSLNAILENDQGVTGQYATGPGWSTIYMTDGTSDDTEYARYGIFTYTIEVNCCSFQPEYAQWRNASVERQRTAWQFFLNRTLSTPSIQGNVSDALTGLPLRAAVTLAERPLTLGEAPRRAFTTGRYFRLTEPNRTYTALFSHAGYCDRTFEVSVGAGVTTLDVELTPATDTPPSSPSPADGTRNIGDSVTLSWQDIGAASYDVYFGTVPEPPFLQSVTQAAFTPPPLSTGRTYYWKIGVATSCGSITSPVWSFSTIPFEITSVTKAGGPFRLIVNGTGFAYGCRVLIDGAAVPATSWKSDTKLIAKKGAALKAMVPKGVDVQISVADDQGGLSAPFTFRW